MSRIEVKTSGRVSLGGAAYLQVFVMLILSVYLATCLLVLDGEILHFLYSLCGSCENGAPYVMLWLAVSQLPEDARSVPTQHSLCPREGSELQLEVFFYPLALEICCFVMSKIGRFKNTYDNQKTTHSAEHRDQALLFASERRRY